MVLFIVVAALAYRIGVSAGAMKRDKHWEEQIPEIKKDSIDRSRASLSGQFSEQLAPYLPNLSINLQNANF